MFVPIFFFYRRLIFIASVILLRENVLGLFSIQISLILCYLTVLLLLKPLESRSALKKQTFDECTYLVLIYLLMCFTNFVPDPENRSKIGNAYISVMIVNIGVHLIILIGSTILSFRLKIKRCFARRSLYRCCCFWKKKTRKLDII